MRFYRTSGSDWRNFELEAFFPRRSLFSDRVTNCRIDTIFCVYINPKYLSLKPSVNNKYLLKMKLKNYIVLLRKTFILLVWLLPSHSQNKHFFLVAQYTILQHMSKRCTFSTLRSELDVAAFISESKTGEESILVVQNQSKCILIASTKNALLKF